MPDPQRGAGAQARFERVDPKLVLVGGGSLLYVESSVSAAGGISRLDVVFGGRAHPAVLCSGSPDERPERRYFWAAVPVAPSIAPGRHALRLRARFLGGAVDLDVTENIEVRRSVVQALAHEDPTATEPLVAICLATHNPPPDLFECQIETIRAQSHERFVCLISDDVSEPRAWERIERAVGRDSRFIASRAASRLGFYRNFERCLSLVPEAASFVALCDQDDRWHPDKIATLVGKLEGRDAMLVFSDMNVATADGRLIATTYWLDRKNNFSEMGSLLLSNTVTGAASLFRRELLDDVLPFPPDVGQPYHDHWIACVALALGQIAYVDRPLHDYVQHPENILGYAVPSDELKGGLLHALGRLVAQPRQRLTNTARHAGDIYRRDVVRLELFARTLELRLGNRMVRSRAKDVRRAARIGRSPRSLAWLLGRSARDVRGRSATLGAENQLVKGIVWRHWQAIRVRVRSAGPEALAMFRK